MLSTLAALVACAMDNSNNINYLELVMEYHKSMQHNQLNLVYEGEVNQSITKAFTAMAERNLSEEKEERGIVKKVYHVMVECLQNIYKHADERVPDTTNNAKRSHGIFLIGQDEGGYVISTGNAVKTEKVQNIKELIDKLNSMETEEVNKLYKTQIRDGILSEKGGAGLGFIDIARKTGSELEYKFETIDDDTSFFILKTYIAK